MILEDHIHFDADASGTIEQRPSYKRLLSAAKAHQFRAIIVEAQDRLWRDQAEMHFALKRLRYWGVKVFSVANGTDITDETGNLVATITGLKDSMFVEDLRKKTRRGMLGRVTQGFSVGGRAYGYRSEPVHDESRRDSYGNPVVIGYRRVIDPAEAAVVHRIFRAYSEGTSPKTIAKMLNTEHVSPPRTSNSLLGWTWTTIAGSSNKTLGILHNPLYVGRLVWNRSQKVRDPDTGKRIMRMRPREEWVATDAPYLRIIPHELWEAVQKRSAGQKAKARGNTGGRRPPKYLFSGLLKCAECGSNYVVKSGSYYGCAANINRGPATCSNTKQVRRVRLEETPSQSHLR